MGVNSTPPDLCIITELMPRGSLYDVLHEKFDIPVPFRVKMALDVLRGLQFIHSAGFIHRDLKCVPNTSSPTLSVLLSLTNFCVGHPIC